ncbi:MAG: DUF4292 domain-containing protein [Flavobacteriales bacterium]
MMPPARAMKFRSLSIVLPIALVVIASFSSCRKSKDLISAKEPLRDRPSGHILRQYEQNEFKFDWLGMKIDAETQNQDESVNFKATVRMRRDSAIWISLSPALGIEVFRVLITQDSVKYISRIPENKYYYLGGFQSMNELLGVEMDFPMLQDLLIGNAIGLDREEGRFRSEIDQDNYLLISRYKRKVRRVVGVDDRKITPQDSISVNPDDPRFRRAVKRADDDDLIISRYWLNGETFRLVRSLFDDILRQRSVEVNYSDFQAADNGQFYPGECRLKITSPGMQQDVSFRITKIVTGKTYDFPFEIPDDFERKLSP